MKLPTTLTLEQAAAALQALSADGSAVIDASALREFDSSALALLLEARRRAEAGGRAFEVQGAPPKLQQLARLYGVAELLGLAPQGAGA